MGGPFEPRSLKTSLGKRDLSSKTNKIIIRKGSPDCCKDEKLNS
jgi:hypothetical protein